MNNHLNEKYMQTSKLRGLSCGIEAPYSHLWLLIGGIGVLCRTFHCAAALSLAASCASTSRFSASRLEYAHPQ